VLDTESKTQYISNIEIPKKDLLENNKSMGESVSILISLAALVLSGTTAWLTLLRRGTVRMTKPTVIFFGPDGEPRQNGAVRYKVFLRTLVYSTGKRGRIIESMYVSLRRGETRQTFNIWVYGDDKLARGSGLFVGDTGVVCNHHFLLPDDGTKFEFLPGNYQMDVYASLVGDRTTLHLSSTALSISDKIARQLQNRNCGVYFDWGPDSNNYHFHVDKKKSEPTLIDILNQTKEQ
jgi:hypothetical protein